MKISSDVMIETEDVGPTSTVPFGLVERCATADPSFGIGLWLGEHECPWSHPGVCFDRLMKVIPGLTEGAFTTKRLERIGHIRWKPVGANAIRQLRCAVLNGMGTCDFKRWYLPGAQVPGLRARTTATWAAPLALAAAEDIAQERQHVLALMSHGVIATIRHDSLATET